MKWFKIVSQILVIVILSFILTGQIVSVFKESKQAVLADTWIKFYKTDTKHLKEIIDQIVFYMKMNELYHNQVVAMDEYLKNNYKDYLQHVKYSKGEMDRLKGLEYTILDDSVNNMFDTLSEICPLPDTLNNKEE